MLANPRFISLSGSKLDWTPNDENWRLVEVAEVEFLEKSFGNEKGVECELCGAGGSPNLIMDLQSFLCRSPFIA